MSADQNWLKSCPLCGGDNRCAMAAGESGVDCWCKSATMDPAALAAIAPDSVGKRCLCPACGRVKGETSNAG